MQRTAIVLSRSQRRRMLRTAWKSKDANLRTRYMIILHTAAGNSQQQIAAMLGSSVSTVKRTRTRWRALGEAGLIDRREDNAPAKKADEAYASLLTKLAERDFRDVPPQLRADILRYYGRTGGGGGGGTAPAAAARSTAKARKIARDLDRLAAFREQS